MYKKLLALATLTIPLCAHVEQTKRLFLPPEPTPTVEPTLVNQMLYALGYLTVPAKPLVAKLGWLSIDDEIKDCVQWLVPLSSMVEDDTIKAIILQIDSPGGCGPDAEIISDYIRSAKKHKPIIAFITNMGTSAAYWIASAASYIICPRSAAVGSIGVIKNIIFDKDKKYVPITSGIFKTIKPDENYELTSETIDHEQSRVDRFAEYFAHIVSQNRAIPVPTILSWQADYFNGTQALELGLVDQLGTFADALEATVTLAQEKYGVEYDQLELVDADGNTVKNYQL